MGVISHIKHNIYKIYIMFLPLHIQNKIIMDSIHKYPYLNELNKYNDLVENVIYLFKIKPTIADIVSFL
jgi:hypothetical protein